MTGTGLRAITGYGQPPPSGQAAEIVAGFGVEYLYKVGADQVRAGILLCLLVPALLAVGVASRASGSAGSAWLRQLRAAGAGPTFVARYRFAEVLSPLVVGGLAAGGVAGLLTFVPVAVPWAGGQFDPRFMRERPALLLGAVIAGVLLSAAVVATTALLGLRRRSGQHAISGADSRPMARAVACIAGSCAALVLPVMLARAGPWPLYCYLASILLVSLTIPAVVALTAADIGRRIYEVGDRRGAPGALVGGRLLASSPRQLASIVGGVCLAVLLLGQTQIWANTLSAQYTVAQSAERVTAGRAIQVASDNIYGAAGQSFLQGLDSSIGHVWIGVQIPDGRPPITQVRGDAASLRALGLPCPVRPEQRSVAGLEPWAGTVLTYLAGQSRTVVSCVEKDDLPAMRRQELVAVLVGKSGQRLSVDALSRHGYDVAATGMRLQRIGGGPIAAGSVALNKSRWVLTFAVVGLAVLTLATGAVIAAELLARARAVAVLAAMTARRRWAVTCAFVCVALPVGLGGGMSSVAYFVLARSLRAVDDGDRVMRASGALALTLVICSALVAAAVALWCAREMVAQGARWRPGRREPD